jgi:protein disulfide-isomerase
MDEWVYTADAVVDAAGGLVAVKVDGDERLDLKERFGVTGFPTVILLSPDGTEIRRASGYVSVAEMAEFLKGD